MVFVFEYEAGGGNNGSIAIFSAFYIMFGIIRANKGEHNYKHGLLLTL